MSKVLPKKSPSKRSTPTKRSGLKAYDLLKSKHGNASAAVISTQVNGVPTQPFDVSIEETTQNNSLGNEIDPIANSIISKTDIISSHSNREEKDADVKISALSSHMMQHIAKEIQKKAEKMNVIINQWILDRRAAYYQARMHKPSSTEKAREQQNTGEQALIQWCPPPASAFFLHARFLRTDIAAKPRMHFIKPGPWYYLKRVPHC